MEKFFFFKYFFYPTLIFFLKKIIIKNTFENLLTSFLAFLLSGKGGIWEY